VLHNNKFAPFAKGGVPVACRVLTDWRHKSAHRSADGAPIASLSTRLNQPATTPIVLVMQRLSIFDPVPQLSAKGPRSKLILPTIAIKDEIIPTGKGLWHHRKIGDLPNTSRYPETYLETQKLMMGLRAFEALFPQAPLPMAAD